MSFSKMLISLSAAAMLLGASVAASAAPPPPPPGGHGGPGFHHPGGPGFRPAPPPPRPFHHRPRWYQSWGFWGPALTTGIVVGTMTYPREPRVVERIVEVPVPAGSGGTTSAVPPASYPWYCGAIPNRATTRRCAPARSAGKPSWDRAPRRLLRRLSINLRLEDKPAA